MVFLIDLSLLKEFSKKKISFEDFHNSIWTGLSRSSGSWIRRAEKSGLEIDWYDVTALTTTNQDTHSAGRYVSCTILLTPFITDTIQEKKQSPLYGRVTKKYYIYRNNNKKTLDTLGNVRLLVQNFFLWSIFFMPWLNSIVLWYNIY